MGASNLEKQKNIEFYKEKKKLDFVYERVATLKL